MIDEKLDKKLKDLRDENRQHQFKQIDVAVDFAKIGLKSLLTLNAGALGLIPTFLEVFEQQPQNLCALKIGMFCFVFSLSMTILTTIFAYLSSGKGAQATIEVYEYDRVNALYEIENKRFDQAKKYDMQIKIHEQCKDMYAQLVAKSEDIGKLLKQADKYEAVAVILSFLAIFFFAVGAMSALFSL